MNKEIWKDITGYEGLYQVSDQGRVKSLERKDSFGRLIKERILRPAPTTVGYLIVILCTGGNQKHFAVHRLVCQAFCDNPENKPEVNHINENKTDNRACNLEWCTRRENINHGTRNERAAMSIAKILSKPIGKYTLNGELVEVWQSASEAERQTGFHQSNISAAARGKLKTAYGYVWKYI